MSNDREQRIRDRAYALWEQDGGRHGRHDDHWAQATQEIDAAATGGDRTATARKSPAPSKPKVGNKVAAKTGSAKPAPAPTTAKPSIGKSAPKPATRAKRKSN